MKELKKQIDKNWKLKVSHTVQGKPSSVGNILKWAAAATSAASAAAAYAIHKIVRGKPSPEGSILKWATAVSASSAAAASASAAAAAAYAIWDSSESWNQRAIFAPRSSLHKFHNDTHQH